MSKLLGLATRYQDRRFSFKCPRWSSTVGWARPGNGTWHYENFPKRSLRKGSRLTTIRPTGQPGFRRRVDPVKSGCFSWYKQPHAFRYRDKGGGVPAPHSLNSFVFCGLSLLIGFPRADTEKSGETIAPPPETGVPTGPDSGTEYRASIRPQGVAIVCIYPCGKARNSPPGGALKEGRRTL